MNDQIRTQPVRNVVYSYLQHFLPLHTKVHVCTSEQRPPSEGENLV